MGWDVLILNADGVPKSLSGLPKDWAPKSMGDAAEVRAAIATSAPDVDWTDPAWGVFAGDEFSVEFNLAATGPVDSFALHIRGGGDPLRLIADLCRPNGWAAVDFSTGDLIDLTNPSPESWLAWQQYRDRILGKG